MKKKNTKYKTKPKRNNWRNKKSKEKNKITEIKKEGRRKSDEDGHEKHNRHII